LDRRLLVLSSREVARILERIGLTVSRQHGSHIQYVGIVAGVKRRVTLVADQQNLTPKTLKSMIEQSGLTEAEWLKML